MKLLKTTISLFVFLSLVTLIVLCFDQPKNQLLSLKANFAEKLFNYKYSLVKELTSTNHINRVSNSKCVIFGDSRTYGIECIDTNIYNASVRGLTIGQLNSAIYKLDFSNVKKVIFCLGINDVVLGYKVEEILEKYSLVVNNILLKNPKLELHIFFIQKVGDVELFLRSKQNVNESINTLNEGLTINFNGHQSIHLHELEVNSIVTYAKDGVHFSTQFFYLFKSTFCVEVESTCAWK